MKKIKLASVFFLAMSAYGCSHNKIATAKTTDAQMSCVQIEREISQVENIKKDIDGKRGLSGRNVGMALLFWPGIIVNEMNGSEAAKLANERLSNLNDLYIRRGCK